MAGRTHDPNKPKRFRHVPDQRFRLELEDLPEKTSLQGIDIVAPMGKGQRILIVVPPGKPC
jgi:transcription termination factor Rho